MEPQSNLPLSNQIGGAAMASRTVEEIYKQQQIGEFMTTWEDFPRPGLAAWADRRKAGLMGTAKSTRYTPKFRPFDTMCHVKPLSTAASTSRTNSGWSVGSPPVNAVWSER